MGKAVKTSLSVLLFCAMAFVATGPVCAEFLDDDLTQFTGDFGTWDLYAVVSTEGSLYCYEYTVTYTNPNYYMTRFTVDNPLSKLYTDATHDNAGVVSPIFFKNPTYAAESTIISWSKNGSGMPGAPDRQITFKYYSEYGYRKGVSAWMVGGPSWTSTATTIGIAPEPTSFMGLGLGLCGILAACRRRLGIRKN